jgi:hypothetical protein
MCRNFPRPGIVFKDITGILGNDAAFHDPIEALTDLIATPASGWAPLLKPDTAPVLPDDQRVAGQDVQRRDSR